MQKKEYDTDAASMNVGTPANANEDESATNANLNNKIKSLPNSSKVLLFMKGNSTTLKCRFAQQIVRLLQSNNINALSAYDALADPETLQGLKIGRKRQRFFVTKFSQSIKIRAS